MKLVLGKRERVLVKTRAHRRALRGPFFGFLVLLAGGCYLGGWLLRTDLDPWADEARPLFLALLLSVFSVLLFIWCLRPWLRWANSYTFLTTERIVTKRGRSLGRQQSIGLYAIHDIVAGVRANAPEKAPGTLAVVMAEQRFNIPHVPAVALMRGYCIGAITALPHFPRLDGVNMEEGGADPSMDPMHEARHQQPPEQSEWTEHE